MQIAIFQPKKAPICSIFQAEQEYLNRTRFRRVSLDTSPSALPTDVECQVLLQAVFAIVGDYRGGDGGIGRRCFASGGGDNLPGEPTANDVVSMGNQHASLGESNPNTLEHGQPASCRPTARGASCSPLTDRFTGHKLASRRL